ncbi:DEAD/DEAH box helicase family protein [Pseudoalteromonas ruthenica]|uniref:DEAD/DEAH box helicase family protein n=1 Tax=Pseudoalteromonas ruthenica TaxID=151081 RepID=UPI00241C8525|nr:DEAD/DEAH box helicase family protein [Pseudoalteromonas ruthenica]|tara:strand:- start:44352 stop:46343 length:1992 start_codon:yes stop_codon:yes gene_type:complete
MNTPQKHRQRIQDILSSDALHQHQINAAKKTFSAFEDDNIRAVVTAAEMQAGKSGIALALCCFQRLNLSDTDICDRKQLKDTLYLVTMPDLALKVQAEDDLKLAKNVVVSNFVNFEKALENEFKGNPPKLIIIDECHYGSNISGIRYSRIFDYLEQENDSCKVVFISATPFGALYGAETEYEEALELSSEAEEEHNEQLLEESREAAINALKDSILRRDFGTRLVFHKTSDEYYGVREMLKNGRLINLDDNCRHFLVDSDQRTTFLKQFFQHEGVGWSLVRVPAMPAGGAMEAKQFLISSGVPEHNIFILGNSLSGVPDDQHSTIERFKKDFEDAQLFGDKLIAITVAGCRAGINFGNLMKNNLISTWDSTVASVAAVVQANVGRACGYHGNNTSMHFTNRNAAEAYGATLDYLERTCSDHAASDFDGLKEFFEDICQEYHVNGLDVGLTIKYKRRRPIGDVETYSTDSYIAVPAKLLEPEFDFTNYTSDTTLLSAISILREEFTKNGAPSVKGNRAIRGKKKNWIKAQWVNGDSYDNPEKAGADGPQKERTIMLTNMLDNGDYVEFNRVVAPGSGELTEDKLVTATVFSVYNISRRKVIKTIMTERDVWDMCDHFKIPRDDTMFVLYKRGEYDTERSLAKKAHNELPESTGSLSDESQFSAK